jgi:hypothetical protein
MEKKRGAAGAPSDLTITLDAEDEIKTSAEAWRLQEIGSISALKETNESDPTSLTAAGVTFRRDGDVWVDARLDDPPPKGTETIRVKPFGETYFKLVAEGGRIADWLAVGEQLRVLLDGIVLEIVDEGEDRLADAAYQRIIRALDER